jgi:hypothetical protein
LQLQRLFIDAAGDNIFPTLRIVCAVTEYYYQKNRTGSLGMTKHGTPNCAHPQTQASAGTLGHGDSAALKPPADESTKTIETAAVDDDADSFEDVPTVSNRTNPAIEAPPQDPTPGIGAYRMVRPTAPDIVTPPPATRPPQKPNRLVIGVARK